MRIAVSADNKDGPCSVDKSRAWAQEEQEGAGRTAHSQGLAGRKADDKRRCEDGQGNGG